MSLLQMLIVMFGGSITIVYTFSVFTLFRKAKGIDVFAGVLVATIVYTFIMAILGGITWDVLKGSGGV